MCRFKAIVVAAAVLVLSAACGPQYRPGRIHGTIERPVEAPTRYRSRDREAIPRSDWAGGATWYGSAHHGRRTANGERFDMYAFTAAHRTLPFNTIVRVTRDDDRRSVVVRINDRGPSTVARVIDLSWAAAYEIGMVERGHTAVTIELIEWGDGAIFDRR